MGKSPNPHPDNDGSCKCLNCDEKISSEAPLAFTKNT